MNARTTILSTIRQNLAGLVPSELPVILKSPQPFEISIKTLIERFALELNRVGGEIIQVKNHGESIGAISKSLIFANTHNVMVSGEQIFLDSHYVEQMKQALPETDEVKLCSNESIAILPSVNASVISAWSLIAETGTAVFVSSIRQPRTLGLLPETVFIVATTSQLVSDMEALMTQLRERKFVTETSCVTFVTGPSRTADIEKILVKGVHGPRKVVVILVTD